MSSWTCPQENMYLETQRSTSCVSNNTFKTPGSVVKCMTSISIVCFPRMKRWLLFYHQLPLLNHRQAGHCSQNNTCQCSPFDLYTIYLLLFALFVFCFISGAMHITRTTKQKSCKTDIFLLVRTLWNYHINSVYVVWLFFTISSREWIQNTKCLIISWLEIYHFDQKNQLTISTYLSSCAWFALQLDLLFYVRNAREIQLALAFISLLIAISPERWLPVFVSYQKQVVGI